VLPAVFALVMVGLLLAGMVSRRVLFDAVDIAWRIRGLPNSAKFSAARFLANQKGYQGAVGTVVTIIAVALAIVFGGIIIGSVQGSLPSNLDNSTTTLITGVINNVYNAFNLMGSSIIVMVAGFILSVLVAGFLVYGRR